MRTISEAGNLAGKKVLVRNDFNITIDDSGKILDDYRIRASLPTIKYLLEQKTKIILSSHFARPEGKVVGEMRLSPVQKRLGELLGIEIKMAPDCIGPEVEKLVNQLKNDEILLLENLRFHPEEEANSDDFAKKLSGLAEVYVNDAFGASHRVHASIVSVTRYLPSFAGLLLQKEFEALSKVLENPERPLTVVIGGAKISTKMKLIEEYLKKADHIILGGALANTVLHAQGIAVGKSLIEEEVIPDLKKLKLTDTKLHIPVDVVASADKTGQAEIKIDPVGRTGEGELILDIGPETEKVFDSVIRASKMVIWNGPMGYFEVDKFSHGTEAMAHSISNCPTCFSIIGGGETTCFVEKFGLIDNFSHVSTGGGAMLEFLAGDKLPGIEALN
ncbi:MAG: phosphoglycerate kinase [Candidatus Portnoybacteria bacterium RBG_19FT_COMBO_36_7]|uniref:Phosphoglycerate kinase n=1 Tax=Candidatus Portnoybacteria bacterium RBG_19FT_COMBO_36_7 TaxID=1801992 RepID=A0A1G2F844_9BACT|nr:MAG: phosphoglycerate kinase [Candidatus Portnoybacteria bacterium RBG_19FT_COMBO_36_7]